MPEEDERLWSEQEVAKYLAISLRTLQRWRAEGKGPPHLMMAGRYPRYRKAEVDAWLRQQEDS
jgi:excisionase family DNA binding protein